MITFFYVLVVILIKLAARPKTKERTDPVDCQTIENRLGKGNSSSLGGTLGCFTWCLLPDCDALPFCSKRLHRLHRRRVQQQPPSDTKVRLLPAPRTHEEISHLSLSLYSLPAVTLTSYFSCLNCCTPSSAMRTGSASE